MRFILLFLCFNLLYPVPCGALPDFSYWIGHLPSYESPTNNLIPWTLEELFFWTKYLPFYVDSSEPQKPWNYEDFQSEDVVPHIRIPFQLFGGFLSDPVGDPYVPPGHARTREWCLGNALSEPIAPREKPTVLQRIYHWMKAKIVGDDPPPVVPRKDPSECEIPLCVWLIRGVSCAILMSPLFLILSLAIALVLSEREEEEPSDSDEEPDPESALTSTAKDNNNVLEDQEACKEPIYTPESRRTQVLPKEELPGPSMAPAPQNVKERPKPKYNVEFSDIVLVRTIPPDNRGRKARCCKNHSERILVYERQQPGAPECGTPRP